MINVRQDPTITLEKDSTKVILTLDDAVKVRHLLDSFIQQNPPPIASGDTANEPIVASEQQSNTQPQHSSMSAKAVTAPDNKPVHMSEQKRNQLRAHVMKKLTAEPQSLTTLLKGVSYVPNYLPVIRDLIEHDSDIGVHNVGKRVFYFKKHSASAKTPASIKESA